MPRLLVIFCCVFSAIGSFLFGYDSGIISSSIAQPNFIATIGGGKLQDSDAGAIVSTYTGGAIVGTVFVSFLADRHGRRVAIFVGALLAILGGVLQGGAPNLAAVVTGRTFAGIAVGLLSATIPNYCSEVAPPRIRGLLAGMQQWMLGLGFVFAQWIGYGSSRATGPFTWRFPLTFQALPALVLALGVLWLPESPRFLIEQGQYQAAKEVLRKLHLVRDGSNEPFVDREYKEICEGLNAEKALTSSTRWRSLLTKPSYRYRVLLACSIQAMTQTSGVNVINYYGPRIYATLGFSTTRSLLIIGIYGILAQVWNTVCLAVVDRINRKTLLIPSMLGMGAALCVNATLAHYFDPSNSHNANALRASVAMNFVFSVFFTSLGVISWIYASEIFPTAIRARGTALSTLTNWSFNLIFAQCSPIALSRMGYRYFYIFMALNWAGAVAVWVYFPETLGRTLEEIDELFGDRLVNHALTEPESTRTMTNTFGQAKEPSDTVKMA